MKPFLSLIFVLILASATGHSQTAALPGWFMETFKAKGFGRKYELGAFLKPAHLQADFNGDGTPDIAIAVVEKATKKKGVLLVHGKANDHFVFGAGTDFGSGSDNFRWADKWMVYKKKTALETQFDKESGDILDSKEIKLARPAISISDFEDGAAIAGGLIYWSGKKYVWIHQGE